MANGVSRVLQLKGFDKLLEDIEAASGETERAVTSALQAGAQILTKDFRNGAQSRGLPTDSMIQPQVKWDGNRASVECGWKLGAYDPKKPSDGYKVLFKEYGAPSKGGDRSTKKGANRGREAADPFIRPALEADRASIKKAEQEALKKVLERVSK